MELEKIFRIMWDRIWLIVLATVLITAVVLVTSMIMEPVYQAKVTMMVKQSANAPLSDYTSIMTGEDLALTYSELLKTRPLLEIVIANLGLDISTDDLIDEMLGTELIPGTQLLALTIEDSDPQRASSIANEIAFTFISLHNTEKQLQSIAAIEHDVATQMAYLKELVEHNQSVIDQARISSGLLTEETTLLQTTLSNQQLAYAGLLGTYLNVRLTQAQLLDVTVVEPAIPPIEPIRPIIVLYTLLGAFIGLIFSVGLAFLIEYLNQSFATDDDIRQVLSLPALGTIPQMRGEERHNKLVTSTIPRSLVSESYRTLRTNIRFASVDEPVTTLLITSAEPGAGKTTVAANLGIVCAQAGLQVVLIDADLRRPSLHQSFDLSNRTGLTDLLVGDVQDIRECMVRTRIDNLHLVTAGPIPPNPSELLGSKMMETVLARVKKSADLVILDTPPTLAATDAAVLAPKMDGVILLIEARRTSHQAARRACETLQHVGATILGTVLTKAKVDRKSSPYYYYTAEAQPTKYPVWKHWLDKPAKFS
ncbi:MAG: polysaccharide biosynthesis tyrosine autokinase [Chloroflexota bacterium]|nr:polysaccharide biosynthesis tyrosine autokinase [Chloroflexota bacterium]